MLFTVYYFLRAVMNAIPSLSLAERTYMCTDMIAREPLSSPASRFTIHEPRSRRSSGPAPMQRAAMRRMPVLISPPMTDGSDGEDLRVIAPFLQ